MEQKQQFIKEFNTLDYALRNSKNVLIVAHSNPDADAVGAVVAFKLFIEKYYNISVKLACYDKFPEEFQSLISAQIFYNPKDIDLTSFDMVIGCDSVDRGFNKIITKISDNCVTTVIDHHWDTQTKADIFMNDASYSSACEILYNFFVFVNKKIDKKIATALLMGIIFDTGGFRHANTTSDTLSVAADLIKYGASATKINSTLLAKREVETLNLWGMALERTKFYKNTGLAVSVITENDLQKYTVSSKELSNVASMLTTVPDIKAALVVYQADKNTIKGSLRAEKYGNVDVSKIAHTLGGGGHKLASGFTIKGRVLRRDDGMWRVV